MAKTKYVFYNFKAVHNLRYVWNTNCSFWVPLSAFKVPRVPRLSPFKVPIHFEQWELRFLTLSINILTVRIFDFRFNYNYGVIGLMDYLHGTDSLFRKSKQFLRNKRTWTTTPVKVLIPWLIALYLNVSLINEQIQDNRRVQWLMTLIIMPHISHIVICVVYKGLINLR